MDYLILQIAENNVTVARFDVTRRSTTMAGSAQFELNAEQDMTTIASRIAAGISGSPRVVLCLPPDLFAQRWWKETDPCQEPLPAAAAQGKIWADTKEVYFLA